MMSNTARKTGAALLATGLFAFSGAAMATNGYFTHGVGTESKGMGGAGVASPASSGAISIATNPALGVFADDKWQLGMAIFSPRRSYTARDSLSGGFGGAFALSSGTYDSENEAFPIPYVAKNWGLNDRSALTFVFYGRGGMNTEWNSGQTASFDPTGQGGAPSTFPGLYGGGKAGVDLMQAFLSVNYSYKVNDRLVLGIGPVAAAQVFEANGLIQFTPYTKTFADTFAALLQQGVPIQDAQQQAFGAVTSLTNNGRDTSTGFGVAAGLWAGTDALSFGLAYQSKMSMSEFDDYSDLYANQGGFDIPSTIKAGVSFLAGETVRINLDFERINYSDVDSVHNPILPLLTQCFTANPAATSSDGCLGGPNGAGFGWEDMDVFKIGFEWAADENNTWRVGYSYGEQPIPSSEVLFNILAPGVMEQHMTVGWTRRRDNGHIMSFSFMYAPSKEVSGNNAFDIQPITLEMSQLEFEFAYSF
jgi:long-chain fatty acid transport protein